jgi:ATP-dependent protease ClpP protease subunit
MLAWPALILWGCVALGVACAIAGAVIAAVGARRVKTHLGRLARTPIFQRLGEAQANAHRIQIAAEDMTPLLQRASAALTNMNAAVTRVRLPQAIAALRLARVSIRLLLAGR